MSGSFSNVKRSTETRRGKESLHCTETKRANGLLGSTEAKRTKGLLRTPANDTHGALWTAAIPTFGLRNAVIILAVAVFALSTLPLAFPAQAVCTGSCLTIDATAAAGAKGAADTNVQAHAKPPVDAKTTAAANAKPEVQVLKIASGQDTVNLGEKAVPLGELREKREVSKKESEAEEGLSRERAPGVKIERRKHGNINIQIGDKTYAQEGKDIVRFGQDVVVAEGDSIDGNVVAIGGTVTVNGMVTGDCVSVGGSISIGPKGVIEGDAVSVGGCINREPGSVLQGDEVCTGGNIPRWLFPGGWPKHGLTGLRFAVLTFTVGKALIVLLLAWLIVFIAQDKVKRTSEKAKSGILASFGVGLLTIILAPIAMVLLCITLIGIPVAILLPFALIVVGLFGYTAVGLALGQRLFGGGPRVISAVAAALLGVLVMEAIPIVGRIVGLPGGILWGFSILIRVVGYAIMVCAILIGIGATILSKFGQGPRVLFPGAVVPPTPGMPSTGAPTSVPPAPGMAAPGAPTPGGA